MLPGGRQRRVGQRRDGDVEVGPRRDAAVLGLVERALEVVHLGADVDAAGQQRRRILGAHGRERRQCRERQVHLRAHALLAVAADAQEVLGVEHRGVEQAQERAVRVDARRRPRRAAISSPPCEHDARHAAVARRDALRPRRRCGSRAPKPRAASASAVGERAEAAGHERGRARRRCRRARPPAAAGSRWCRRTRGRRTRRRCRARTRPRAGSRVSNHSAAKSATAIGMKRSRRWPSSRPRPPQRAARGRAAESASPESGPVDVGRRQRAQRATARRRARPGMRWNSGIAQRRPSARSRWISAADRSGLPHRRRLRPSGSGANRRGSGSTKRSPRAARPSASATSFAKSAGVCATAETRKPGMELLGRRGAAHDVALLEHDRRQAALREQRRRHQAVVPAADDRRRRRPRLTRARPSGSRAPRCGRARP